MTETVGILSILDGDLAHECKRLWKLFETQYASRGVQSFDYPNVSFQGGICHHIAAVETALADLSRVLHPFDVTIDGLDYFAGHAKTIFLNVQLTDELRHVNQIVNEMLSRACETTFELYHPDQWRPHVTLAMTDLTDDNFARAWNDLQGYHPRFEQTITNICLVYLNELSQHFEMLRRETLA